MSDNIQEEFYNACRDGKLETVKQLIDQVDVNKYHEDEKVTPLYAASENDHVEIVKMLLKHPKIDVNKGPRGGTPLYVASSNNYVEVVKLLLEHPQIDVNKELGLYYTPLCIASLAKHIEVVKLLLKHPKIDLAMKEKSWTAERKELVGQCLGELGMENKSTNPSQKAASSPSSV
eukprot:CAMPEP_0201545396 /NCGR_PEP_ID=MMETSP0173_2-20130828/1930_1 /ASSEMBLY_ACC=CAM_ASM_000268 /TAXON_ID=218659 /ORGANISM="Vexillifera sp., Strain DIVA3 564/2" /LENGTH=174 /DNA_ID=CAMNT_0047953795 /DNA_START=67 /DNA_END=591 /DNA_ORIENTATION=+